jgi:hypothetical protein
MTTDILIVWLEEVLAEEGMFEVSREAFHEECGVRCAEERLEGISTRD